MPWAIIFSFLSSLPGLIGNYFQKKTELEIQKVQTQQAIELATQQAVAEAAKAQFDLNKTIVNATSSNFKYFTFFMWFGPFMIGTVWPRKAAEIFANLSTMPEWYVQSCMLIMFTVWGISVSAPVVGNIFSGLSQYFKDRREYKLEKARINRDAVFSTLRSKMFPNGMNQSQVNIVDEALDKGENS